MPLSPAFPSAFHGEHTPSKSRVFALVDQPGQVPTLAAVLTVTDAALAEEARRVLELVRIAAPGDAVLEEIGAIAQGAPHGAPDSARPRDQAAVRAGLACARQSSAHHRGAAWQPGRRRAGPHTG
jgi:hypothetical protein